MPRNALTFYSFPGTVAALPYCKVHVQQACILHRQPQALVDSCQDDLQPGKQLIISVASCSLFVQALQVELSTETAHATLFLDVLVYKVVLESTPLPSPATVQH